MSQYPDPGQPPQYQGNAPQPSPYAMANYYSGGGVISNPRPQSVTAVAIIGIVIGSLSVLCTAPGFLVNLTMLGNGGRNPFAPQLPPMSQAVVGFSVFQSLLNFALALTMLICCIAALKLKPFARKVMIPLSIVIIVWAIIVTITTTTWLMPEIHKTMQPVYRQNPAMQGPQQIGEMIGAVLTAVVMCAVPFCVLLLWTRPHVKAAFGEQMAIPVAPYPGTWPQGGGPT